MGRDELKTSLMGPLAASTARRLFSRLESEARDQGTGVIGGIAMR